MKIYPLFFLLVFVPVSILLEILHANEIWIFASSAAAIIPLAALMGKATEHLSEKLGAGVGGLLNASFGNAAELIIALMAMRRGLYDVVKASITGSIIGNVLLVLGLSIVAGGMKYERQVFNRTAASNGATLLALSAIGLVVPAIFHMIVRTTHPEYEQQLNLEIAIVLFITYILNLLFTLKTHKHIYAGDNIHSDETSISGAFTTDDENPTLLFKGGQGGVTSGKNHSTTSNSWSRGKALSVLLISTAFVALMSEFLVGAVEHTAKVFGMTEVFVGVILVAIIGNAAEHSTAVIMALKNKMDIAMNIAIGSSIQIALFVAPVLVFVSYFFGPPMDLLFTTFEVLSIVLTVGIVSLISLDGESNWMEGVQLLAVYIILGIAFFYLP